MTKEIRTLRKKIKDLEIENNQIRWTSAANARIGSLTNELTYLNQIFPEVAKTYESIKARIGIIHQLILLERKDSETQSKHTTLKQFKQLKGVKDIFV